MSLSREEELHKKLSEPFPAEAIKWRWADRAQTRKLDYVQGHTVIRRLNEATGNRWDFTVDKLQRTQIDDANALLMAYVTLTIPGLGSRSHVGVQSVNARGGEDLVKGAVTDALKKAATLFNVGIDLYGPDYEAGEITNVPQTRSDAPGATLPPRDRSTTTNAVPNIAQGDTTNSDAPITDWTEFWNRVRKLGIAADKKHLEEQMGQTLPFDPAFAFEVVRAWVHDTERQAALP